MKLYPLLEYSKEVESEAMELARLSVDDCRQRRKSEHPSAFYSALGGNRCHPNDLHEIQESLTEIARQYGYPEETPHHGLVDAKWGIWLHENLDITPHEASKDSVWQFLTVALLPDLVRWRWGEAESKEASDRWITVRHRGRNTFGRLWWRCEILINPEHEKPYSLFESLREDELVQIMERPSFAGNRMLSKTTASVLIAHHDAYPKVNRMLLLRDYQKRMLRLGAFIDFQALDQNETRALAEEIMNTAAEHLKSVR